MAAAATSTCGASEDMLDELDVIFRKWKKELKVLLLDSTRETWMNSTHDNDNNNIEQAL